MSDAHIHLKSLMGKQELCLQLWGEPAELTVLDARALERAFTQWPQCVPWRMAARWGHRIEEDDS